MNKILNPKTGDILTAGDAAWIVINMNNNPPRTIRINGFYNENLIHCKGNVVNIISQGIKYL